MNTLPQDHDPSHYMRLLVDHVPSMLAYWDHNLRCRFANRAYKRWFGLSPEQIIGASMPDILGPRLFALNEDYIMGALRGQAQAFERIIPGPDGVQRYSQANYLPDIVDGRVMGFLAEVTEITRLKETEAALRASEAFLDRTGRIAGVGGWEIDLRTNAITWSEQTCRIHGVPPGYQPTPEDALKFVAPEARDVLQAAFQEGLQQGKAWDMTLPVLTAQGQRIWARSLGEVEFENGQPIRVIGAVQDISERLRHQRELQSEKTLRAQIEVHAQELKALLAERSDMLDVLAHEVRQPLNNASAALQSANATLADVGETVAALRLVRAQTVLSQVLASIDNTLAVASLLARSEPVEPEDTDVDTLIAVTIADMPAGERARIRIERVTSTRTASMDMSLMRLALRNLLSNALKYSPPEGEVVVRLTDSDEPLALVIDVDDQGAGVGNKLLPKLFERGARGQSAGGPSGHGLGLYIVRRVMELHSGRVELVRNGPDGVTMRLIIAQAQGN